LLSFATGDTVVKKFSQRKGEVLCAGEYYTT